MTPPASAQPLTPTNPRGMRDLPFELRSVEPAQKRRAKRIRDARTERYPDAKCALTYTTPHELLIATILSAQCTDVAVNKATPALFKKFPKPADYANSTPAKIEPFVKSLNFFRNKAKAVHESMAAIVDEHGGKTPQTMDELLALRGVARKTANVVLGNAFNINNGVVVDTHVNRIAKRFGLAPEDSNVQNVERHLMALFPRDRWTALSHLIIYHGRQVCKARHGLCAEDSICKKYCSNAKEPA